MENLKLTIELIPKGAWGNNLREVLSKNEWDTLRNVCYEKANGKCEICGYETDELQAHEVWDFNIKAKTQTLNNIIALCSKCHGVKHMRNSERLGYGDNAKKHFCKINGCNEMALANHIFKTQLLFEERNKIYRWKLVADLDKFGGKGMKIKQKNIPLIINPYEGINFLGKSSKEQSAYFNIYTRIKDSYFPVKVNSIIVDNYLGIIKINCNNVNKIEWFLDGKLIRTKYNIIGNFKTELKVENLTGFKLFFRLTGDSGIAESRKFELKNYSNEIAKKHKGVL